MTSRRIVLVGGGPRAVSLLERIAANAPDADGLEIVVIDDVQPGAGRVWRTDQTREMCMNTLAGAVTMFTDASVTMDGPVVPGPTLHEWCRLALASAGGAGPRIPAAREPSVSARAECSRADVREPRLPGVHCEDLWPEALSDFPSAAPSRDHEPGLADPAHVAAFREVPVRDGLVDAFRDELSSQRPESHPSRALFGEYLLWCLAWARGRAERAGFRVSLRTDRAVTLSDDGDRQALALASGVTLAADAVVLAPGWLDCAPVGGDAAIARAVAADPGLAWVRPGSPIDQAFADVPAGEAAIVRGLGMGFFDAMALVTIGRGGRFVERGHELRYMASGLEPVMHVTSHRGVPYRAKSAYGGLPPAPIRPHLSSIDWTTRTRTIDFDAEMWPLILRDAFVAHSTTLERVRPGSIDLPRALDAIAAAEGSIAALAEATRPFVCDPSDMFDAEAELFPGRGRSHASPAEFQAWAEDFVARDLAEAARGADSPVKAALWSVSAARGFASRVGAFGGFDAESRASGFRTLFAVGGMAGSGPPAFRNRQLLALARAGVVRFLGPAGRVRVERDDEALSGRRRFVASSDAVDGSELAARVLVDAWMRAHDVSESADPLVRSLVDAGRARAFAVRSRDGGSVRTGGIDVDPATGRLVRADGSVDPAVHAAGIPLNETRHDTLISPMPGADANMLRETDAIARSVLDGIFARERT
ncbi:FAD/NAD(P)-binding protein [Microbacterium karelineae]|uniref:FAD/NAD(P)-binding protein n=1 Tax=Microbacterium karelineae TaxID=2654283 RepID=UPI0012E9DF97|nr:FAD/NAD(P)-binding protein [Microbacterium karelineae]